MDFWGLAGITSGSIGQRDRWAQSGEWELLHPLARISGNEVGELPVKISIQNNVQQAPIYGNISLGRQ